MGHYSIKIVTSQRTYLFSDETASQQNKGEDCNGFVLLLARTSFNVDSVHYYSPYCYLHIISNHPFHVSLATVQCLNCIRGQGLFCPSCFCLELKTYEVF